MPLLKRKPFSLVEPPKDLEPQQLVFQVRFTKEIFKDYQEYLNRINLYRRRLWTCKVTGKSNLTYEEALISEQSATEKVQQFPKELMEPVLRITQFSTLTLTDLLRTIIKKLQERLPEGLELFARKKRSIVPCKILKILEDADDICYEVAWIDNDKKLTGTSVVNADDIVRKKLPFNRDVLKSFIRESTSQSSPWVVHDNLAREYGVPTEPPVDFQKRNGSWHIISKRKELERDNPESLAMRKKAKREEPTRYPIDDLLVQPGSDDPIFRERPPPSRGFTVQMDCVGDLIMAWDFCSSFCKLLHLSPFSLEDFDNAICHKDSNVNLIMESHSAIFQLLIKEDGEYFAIIQKKKRKAKITLLNWMEYLYDFLELQDVPELCTSMATIKRGHYGLLDPHAKLTIFRRLITQALATNTVRDQLDEYIEQRQALASTKREIALEEGRKRREAKLLKTEINAKEVTKGQSLENGWKLRSCENGFKDKQNVDAQNERNDNIIVYTRRNALKNRESKDVKQPSSNEGHNGLAKQRKVKATEAEENVSEEQRKELLEREIEKRIIRTSPLGKDKNHNRYWLFRRDGRLFVENPDSNLWGYYSTKEELDELMASLNPKGERERALKRQLEKCYDRICLGLQKRSRDIASKLASEEAVVRRSIRVRAPLRNNPAMAFLRYVNKWKENDTLGFK